MRRTTEAPKRRTSLCVPDQPGAMPSPNLGKAELNPALGDANVGDGRQFEAAAESVPGQRGDEWNTQARQRFESAMSRARPVAPHFEGRQAAPGGDIAAGAERLALAGEDRDPRFGRRLDGARRVGERVDHRPVKRVQLVGALQREPR